MQMTLNEFYNLVPKKSQLAQMVPNYDKLQNVRRSSWMSLIHNIIYLFEGHI